ncbi:MAG: hypothetical protein KDK65_04925 [Chlamydiia bacterium]|nr:hypothetical protein [Chlamydiia bacterium]
MNFSKISLSPYLNEAHLSSPEIETRHPVEETRRIYSRRQRCVEAINAYQFTQAKALLEMPDDRRYLLNYFRHIIDHEPHHLGAFLRFCKECHQEIYASKRFWDILLTAKRDGTLIFNYSDGTFVALEVNISVVTLHSNQIFLGDCLIYRDEPKEVIDAFEFLHSGEIEFGDCASILRLFSMAQKYEMFFLQFALEKELLGSFVNFPVADKQQVLEWAERDHRDFCSQCVTLLLRDLLKRGILNPDSRSRHMHLFRRFGQHLQILEVPHGVKVSKRALSALLQAYCPAFNELSANNSLVHSPRV